MKKISLWKEVGESLSALAIALMVIAIVVLATGAHWEIPFFLFFIAGAPCLIGGISLQFAYYKKKSEQTENEVKELKKEVKELKKKLGLKEK